SAGQELRGLVRAGLIEQTGFGRWTRYAMVDQKNIGDKPELEPSERKIINYAKAHGSINNAECRDLLEVDTHRASYLLRKMTAKGTLIREGKHRWTKYRPA
ncbi:MAG: hypothetical protein GY862_03535, partial [Gammaproteobacteria bacterium]|nr:hypothetical protein [Gammaproteobacteria bacterium]